MRANRKAFSNRFAAIAATEVGMLGADHQVNDKSHKAGSKGGK